MPRGWVCIIVACCWGWNTWAGTDSVPNPVLNKDSAKPPELNEKKPDSIPSWEKTDGFAFALGIPHPLTFELNFRTSQLFQLGFAGGWLPFRIEGTAISFRNVDIRLLFFPGRGRFYVGLDFGYEWLGASQTQNIDLGGGILVPTTVNITLKSPFIIPVAGYMFVFKSGFMLGFEFGLMYKFSTQSELGFTINDPTFAPFEALLLASPNFQSTQTTVQNMATTIGNLRIPHFTLIRFGWMF
jgi:hypothetical protein